LYQDHVKFIVNRVNSVNGRVYKNDPTILAWNLVNEPRCETWVDTNSDCVERLDSWFADMAEYVRSLDPNHLVTTGTLRT
jgi:mannan endo-1,4-beta-mannosidase